MIENLLSTLRKNSWLVGATFCMAMFYSCEEDVVESRPQLSGDEIVFSVATDSTWQAMGTASSRAVTKDNSHFLTALGEDSLYISMVEEENHTPVFVAEADSVDSRGASAATHFTKYYLTAYLNDESEYMKNQLVEKDGTGWKYSPIKYWPADKSQSIHFFGYLKTKDTGEMENLTFSIEDTPESYQGEFTYTLPVHDATNKDDATWQPDLVFAITPNQNQETNNGTVDLNFQHALSAVVFKIGTVPDNVKINSVTFSKVYGSGSCEMTSNGSDIDFNWLQSGELQDYTQTFDKSVVNGQDINSVSDETCFMMVPQTFNNDATLSIAITVNGRPYTMEKNLKEIIAQWEANKKYTYIISLPDEVKVNVDDDVDKESTHRVKSDLEITNTGIAPIYVRVAMIGNWVDQDKGDIVADWRNTGDAATDDGTFIWISGEPQAPNGKNNYTRNWVKHDGFYYYMKEIARGASIPDADLLFETYTLKEDNAPVPGANLELTIAVQALRKEDLQWVWPEEVRKVLP